MLMTCDSSMVERGLVAWTTAVRFGHARFVTLIAGDTYRGPISVV